MEIKDKLKEKRLKAELTQKELADILHVSRQTVSSWEVGRTYPDLDILVSMSELYNTPLDDLLKEDSDMVRDITKRIKQSQLNRKIILFLILILVAVLSYGGYGAYENYIQNQANEEGLTPSDLLNSTWQMNYDPTKDLSTAYLSFGSKDFVILNDYGERYQFFLPGTSQKEVDSMHKEWEEKGLKSGVHAHKNMKIKTEGNTYIVEAYGYRQLFERLSGSIIKDANGVEYYLIDARDSHEFLQEYGKRITEDNF